MPVLGSGVEICTSTTRPSSPVVGTMIYETDTASYRWCTAISPSVTWLGLTPSGTIQSFAGNTSPTGWLLCDGTSLNATTNPKYADLFAAIGTTYGGTGITAFNLPNLTNKFLRGNATSGITGGADSEAHQHGYRLNIAYYAPDGQGALMGGYHYGSNYGSATNTAGFVLGFANTYSMQQRQDNTFSQTVNTVPSYVSTRYIIKV